MNDTNAHRQKTEETKPQAENALQAVSEYAREHPLVMVAGGIAIGLIAGSLLPRGAGRAVARRASSLAELGAAAAATLGANAMEKAETAKEAGLEFGRQALDRTETARHNGAELGRQALDRAGAAASALGKRSEAIASDALSVAGETGHRIARKAEELASRISH